MPKVKICGITNPVDAKLACEAGADFIGFVFVKGTPRCVSEDEAKNIIFSESFKEYHNKVEKVGLFVNEDINRIAGAVAFCDLSYIQLHGREGNDYCKQLKDKTGCKIIKTIKIHKDTCASALKKYDSVDFFLFDTYHESIPGGTGEKFNWGLLKGLDIDKDFFLAGGLTPENVAEAVKTVKPYAVDVSSGVEKEERIKDKEKVERFIRNAKSTG